jgi:predicted RNA binding protein YcfA (HicA-like mRNA interferase family)
MSRLPSVTGKQIIAALNRMGFQEVRISTDDLKANL